MWNFIVSCWPWAKPVVQQAEVAAIAEAEVLLTDGVQLAEAEIALAGQALQHKLAGVSTVTSQPVVPTGTSTGT